ncbi:MAG: hypothetical protein AAGB31_05290, partial [Bdellovibrio sp.]
FWKAGFNPYTYYNYSTPLSFYSTGERKLYILGGVSGDVKSSDTDHFDDSVVLHEYGHFLEDVYSNAVSPGGSHNGSFIIDARLAWSEGWANYFQAAVLTGADANDNSAVEDRIPSIKRYHYYVDTYGYKGSGNSAGIGIAFNLAAVGTDTNEPDNVSSDLAGTGTFREVSISRTLYKSSRNTSSTYDTGKTGGGVSFANFWRAFAGEDNSTYNSSNPAPYSFAQIGTFPIPNSGLFNWLLTKNSVSSSAWDSILTEEKQNKTTHDYAYLLASTTGCTSSTFNGGAIETRMSVSDPVRHSNQQMNNDFYLYYHNGSSTTLKLTYSTTGTALNLDLILYYGHYVYFEDDYWYANYSSSYIARQSRTSGTTEQISLAGLPAGYYMLNVKINAYNKLSSDLTGTATYQLFRNGTQVCGKEQP